MYPPRIPDSLVELETKYMSMQHQLAGQFKETQLQAYKSAAAVGQVATMVEALKGCNRLTLWDLAIQISGKLDTRVKELALKSAAPMRSRVFSEAEVLEWKSWIQTANADRMAALLCVVKAKDEVETLQAKITELKSSSVAT